MPIKTRAAARLDRPRCYGLHAMARRPYVASGRFPDGAMPKLAALSVGAGLGTGLVEGFASQWLSLLLVYPALVGFAAGGVAAAVCLRQRIRNPALAIAIAAVGALLGEGAVHAMQYQHARSVLVEAIENSPDGQALAQSGQIGEAVDSVLAGDAHDLPFVGYLKLAAQNGITITSSHGSSSSGPTLTGVGVYTLWALNLALALGIAIAIARAQAVAPYCEGCDDWYTRSEVIGAGDGSSAKVKELVQRLEAGQLAEAVRELGKTDGKTAATVQLKGCARCVTHEPVLLAYAISAMNTNKRRERVVFSSLVTPQEAQLLRGAQVPAAKSP